MKSSSIAVVYSVSHEIKMDPTTAITIDGPELSPSKYLCLTILGYRKPGMSEEAYRRHMNEVSAPMTKDLMVKHGVKRWTVVCFVKDSG